MENLNLNKQRLIALVIAAAALITMLLPWSVPKAFGRASNQIGFASWGFLSLIGILGIVLLSFFAGDKTREYDAKTKQLVTFAFGSISLGALIFLIRIFTGSQNLMGYSIKYSDIVKPGMGLFLCLLAGLVGIAWIMGYLDKIKINTSHQSAPPPPPPPPPPTTPAV